MNSSGLSHRLSNQLSNRLGVAITAVKGQSTKQLAGLTRLFLNPGCAVCDRPTSHTFCLDCQRQLPVTDLTRKGPTMNGPTPESCSVQDWYKDATHSLPVSALGVYNGTLKRAILAMKYNHRPEVADVLGHQLGQQWTQTQRSSTSPVSSSSLVSSPLVSSLSLRAPLIYAVPIPLHAERYSQRGYNQAELIARAFCKTSGLPLLVDGLARTQATLPQHQLSLNERQQNLAEAFHPGKALRRLTRGAHGQTAKKAQPAAVIIDDIYTTGTTARSAAKTLTEAGIPVVGILALARAVL